MTLLPLFQTVLQTIHTPQIKNSIKTLQVVEVPILKETHGVHLEVLTRQVGFSISKKTSKNKLLGADLSLPHPRLLTMRIIKVM